MWWVWMMIWKASRALVAEMKTCDYGGCALCPWQSANMVNFVPFCAIRGGKFEKVERHRVVWICRQETLWRSSMMHIRGWRSLLSALFFFWNVKGSSKIQNLLGNDLFKISGDRCLPLGFEHISKSTFSRNLGLQTKNCATCVSVESLEKLWTSRVLDDVSTRNGLVNGCPGRSKGLLESTWPNLRWI